MSFNLHRLKINEYLQFHDKRAGEGCQVSFFVSTSYLDDTT
ncbi:MULTISPECIES: hypothetical protein [Wolbachia]|nr:MULTISPECIES: hypothetical protein [Wolbachia]